MEKKHLLPLLLSDSFNEEEIAHLLSITVVQRPLRSPFYLDQIPETETFEWFRFTRGNLPRLLRALRIPNPIRLENGSRYCAMEALCIMLRRLAYPNRYTDIKHIFGRSKPELSMIFTWMIEFMDENYGYLLTSLDLFWLDLEHLQLFANKIHEKGAPLPDLWGFIDGTFRPVCRPGEDQRTLYSGHYRDHGVKLQGVQTPNGLMANTDGPWVGRRHDSGILADSGLLGMLREKMNAVGQVFRLYGDPAYPISAYLEGPFQAGAHALSQVQLDFNEAMAAVRISVEWGFGKVAQNFAFLDFKKNLKIGLQPVGKLYSVGTLLLNCRICLGHGGKVSDYFGIPPPSLEQYLRNRANA